MGSTVQAKVSHQFHAPAERVYDAWLDPEQVRRWMAAALRELGQTGEMRQVEIAPQVGGSYVFSDLRDGQEVAHWGEYLELERPERIVFTWRVVEFEEFELSRVTLTLAPAGEGCTATLTHDLDARWAEYVPQTEHGWACMLAAVDQVLG
jgi:uncharacterized protein YndB with AHSA1/START domain